MRMIGLALACVFVAPPSARAGDGIRTEIAGGYSYVSVGTCSAQTCSGNDTSEPFPVGWFASGGVALTNWIAAVGEVVGNYKSSSDSLGDVTANASLKLHAFVGGARFVRRATQRVTLFGELLVGAASSSARVSASGPGVSADVRADETHFCYQPGGGVDVDMNAHTALRAAAGARLVRAGGATSKEVWLAAGLVYRFGKERN